MEVEVEVEGCSCLRREEVMRWEEEAGGEVDCYTRAVWEVRVFWERREPHKQ